MSRSWSTVDHGRGQKTVFNLDGVIVETGAAGTRCFHDLRRQRGDKQALEAVAEAHSRFGSAFSDAPGGRTFDVNVERLLRGAGVPEDRVAGIAREYRQGKKDHVDLGF
jgi:hypothetical protein